MSIEIDQCKFVQLVVYLLSRVSLYASGSPHSCEPHWNISKFYPANYFHILRNKTWEYNLLTVRNKFNISNKKTFFFKLYLKQL